MELKTEQIVSSFAQISSFQRTSLKNNQFLTANLADAIPVQKNSQIKQKENLQISENLDRVCNVFLPRFSNIFSMFNTIQHKAQTGVLNTAFIFRSFMQKPYVPMLSEIRSGSNPVISKFYKQLVSCYL